MVIAAHIHMNFRTDHKPGKRLQQTVALVSIIGMWVYIFVFVAFLFIVN